MNRNLGPSPEGVRVWRAVLAGSVIGAVAYVAVGLGIYIGVVA